jgi:ATP synthase protein I
MGTLGLVFVLPVVGGAYLGRWLDGLVEGYSTRWTLSMLFLGIIIGAVNVYLFIRE